MLFCIQKCTDCNRLLRKPEKQNSKTVTGLSGASNAEMLPTERKLFLTEEKPIFPLLSSSVVVPVSPLGRADILFYRDNLMCHTKPCESAAECVRGMLTALDRFG